MSNVAYDREVFCHLTSSQSMLMRHSRADVLFLLLVLFSSLCLNTITIM